MARIVFCKILEREITLTRCKPVAGFRVCESCEGYELKVSERMLKKLSKKPKGKVGRAKKKP